MNPTPPKTSAPPLRHETTAGNYFVANYPPFAFWKPEFVSQFEAALEDGSSQATLGQYVHIPFCRKRCHFCYFKVYTDKDSSEVRGYLDALLKELTVYANKPVIGGRKPKFVYFGGILVGVDFEITEVTTFAAERNVNVLAERGSR